MRSSSQPLRFTHVHLRNWRNFLEVDTDLQRRVFLVGANASGKSNFLNVFRFLHDIVKVGGGLQQAVEDRGGVSSIRALTARRRSDIEVDVSVGTAAVPKLWRYRLSFTAERGKLPTIKRETVEREGVVVRERPDTDDLEDPALLTQTHLEQTNANKDFRPLVGFFNGLRYLHVVPQLIREADSWRSIDNDPYGGDLLVQVAKAPQKTREARLRKIQKALTIAVPQLAKLELWRDPIRNTWHLRGKYEHWRPQGAWQTEERFSDGTLRLLGLLWAVLDGSGPLLLEEPELSLHPEVIKEIPGMLARLQRSSGRQVMVSTHSSHLLADEGIGLDEVLVLVPTGEGTTVQPVGKLRDVQRLLEGGVQLPEIVMPHTRPEHAEQLSLFAD
ncbi:MAG: AAA family ATPase [Thermoanaerobaculaceae bacterium]|nr:AAA family ATPase [Thermoanaerobaculaceae bacterium]MDI9620356.1 AAA family ATPase [Acidobacteriota bacterium]NLH10901.1 AAA family ATPase [Holophagae bacterium]HPW54499.1 AAA family ATPase [Thermoanaerobaculaceae bacterium]